MTRIRSTAFAVMAAVICGCSQAALADDIYDKCIDASNDSNLAWARCGNEYVQREKKKLDEAWAKLIRDQEGRTKTDLQKEQKAWQRFSQVACQFYANGDLGREGQVLSYPVCKARLYADRARALQAYESD